MSAISQGADADDFNPDRFIDPDGQVTPALADTKDGGPGSGKYLIHSLTTRFAFAEGNRSSIVTLHFADFNSELPYMYRSRILCMSLQFIFSFLP